MHVVTRGPRLDPVGFEATLMSSCLDSEDAHALLTALASPSPLTTTELRGFVQHRGIDPARLRTCTSSMATRHGVWPVERIPP